jgi:hypothetical protein
MMIPAEKGVAMVRQMNALQSLNLHARLIVAAIIFASTTSATVSAQDATEAAYLKTVTERANKILAPINIDDDARRARVRDLIAQQYVALSHHQRDFEARHKSASGPGVSALKTGSVTAAIEQETDPELFTLHRSFVAKLSAELSAAEVDQVKDGITYGVVPLTYHRYLELLPGLSAEQKSVVLANLLEAREYAMDAGSSEKKHWWFDKYKGRINNYLSAQGFNMKEAEREWQAKRQQKKTAN